MFTLYIPIMVKLSISFINGQSFAYVLGKNPQAAYKCESWSFKQSSRTTKHLPTAAFIKSVVELSPPSARLWENKHVHFCFLEANIPQQFHIIKTTMSQQYSLVFLVTYNVILSYWNNRGEQLQSHGYLCYVYCMKTFVLNMLQNITFR